MTTITKRSNPCLHLGAGLAVCSIVAYISKSINAELKALPADVLHHTGGTLHSVEVEREDVVAESASQIILISTDYHR